MAVTFFVETFLAVVFLDAAFFAVVFLDAAFFAVVFFGAAFLAVTFFVETFLAATFFLAGAFFATAFFFAGLVLRDVDWVAAFLLAAFFPDAFALEVLEDARDEALREAVPRLAGDRVAVFAACFARALVFRVAIPHR